MRVCHCNPFNDASLATFLDDAAKDNQPVRVKDAYRACSGGKNPNCAKCIPMISEAVDNHNEKLQLIIPVKQIECPSHTPA